MNSFVSRWKENSWHFATLPMASSRNDVWETSILVSALQCRNFILMTCHYPDLDGALDWLNKFSLRTAPARNYFLDRTLTIDAGVKGNSILLIVITFKGTGVFISFKGTGSRLSACSLIELRLSNLLLILSVNNPTHMYLSDLRVYFEVELYFRVTWSRMEEY